MISEVHIFLSRIWFPCVNDARFKHVAAHSDIAQAFFSMYKQLFMLKCDHTHLTTVLYRVGPLLQHAVGRSRVDHNYMWILKI